MRKLLVLSPFLFALSGVGYSAELSRDQLRILVQKCLDPRSAGDGSACPAPVADSESIDTERCRTTTQVWDKSTDFVAIRDLKACGCPATFEHGLAMPLAYVRGVESAELPPGIWQFGWDVARRRFSDPSTIALAVNSRLQRSQDQLHIHIVELLPDARSKFPAGYSVDLTDLSQVWDEVRTIAREKNLSDYGVLITHGPADGFTLLVTDGDFWHSPEKLYTRFRCR